MQDRLTKGDKTYEGVLRLGEGTASYDAESDVDEIAPWRHITRSQLLEAVKLLTGEIEQIPPMYSAIKVNGERLYSLARKGKVVERKARRVTIKSFNLYFHDNDNGSSEDLNSGRPSSSNESHHNDDNDCETLTSQDIRFSVKCTSGPYIRTLAYDLGKAVGSVAHLTELRRTEACGYVVDDAWTIDELKHGLAAVERE